MLSLSRKSFQGWKMSFAKQREYHRVAQSYAPCQFLPHRLSPYSHTCPIPPPHQPCSLLLSPPLSPSLSSWPPPTPPNLSLTDTTANYNPANAQIPAECQSAT